MAGRETKLIELTVKYHICHKLMRLHVPHWIGPAVEDKEVGQVVELDEVALDQALAVHSQ